MKLWDKGKPLNKQIEDFTVGRDRELDLFLAPYDVIGSIAHARMLCSIGLIGQEELPPLLKALKKIYVRIQQNDFTIDPDAEDVHSQVEALLTNELGDLGKKIHTGRSRNDQVLLDLKLFMRDAIREIVEHTGIVTDILLTRSEETREILMPGYTHLQVAMPSSFGLWFGAFAESLVDDLLILQGAYRVVNQNPLGSAAGYGSSFPLNRQMTTDLLGFESMNYNVIYAQMGRGKTERIVSFALGNLASTVSKLATDVCLFMSQNFGFLALPDELTTGSSIMPHKKNPDVFELLRARCNKLSGLTHQIQLITGNLPTGYFRDLQIIKEIVLPAFTELADCLRILDFGLRNLKINTGILENKIYDYLFTVEEVNKLVLQGVPFRDAYRMIGAQIESGNFSTDRKVMHVHDGSIGNLCLDAIRSKKEKVMQGFEFAKAEDALRDLLK